METEPSMIDNLSAERVDRRSFATPSTSVGCVGFSIGADDLEAREPGNKSMWFLVFVMT